MLHSVADLVAGNVWGYFVILGVVALDAVFPLLPSETVIIAGAVLASNGDMSLAMIILATAAGAVLGDNVSYSLGDRIGEPLAKRLFKSEKSQRVYAWGSRMICEHTWIVSVARFVPCGRTATTFGAGALVVSWSSFLRWDVVGAVLWATYATMVGYIGGQAFQDSLWRPFVLSTAIALAVGFAGELARRRSARRLERQGKLRVPGEREQRALESS
ncbi:MAG: DedA family protein [Thermoleophilaceae bacterium]